VGAQGVSPSHSINDLEWQRSLNVAIGAKGHSTALATQTGWQKLDQIIHNILPKIAAARERDRAVREMLGLPPHNWEGGS